MMLPGSISKFFSVVRISLHSMSMTFSGECVGGTFWKSRTMAAATFSCWWPPTLLIPCCSCLLAAMDTSSHFYKGCA
jgi:hypothetical protein